MDKKKKDQIEWFIRFLNFDFERGSLAEKLDLLRDMQIIFGKLLHPDLSVPQSSAWNPEMISETLKYLRGILMKFLEELIRKFKEVKKNKDFGYMKKATEIANLQTLGHIKTGVEVAIMIKNKPKVERDPKNSDLWKIDWPDQTLENSSLEVVISPDRGDEGFLFFFIQTINGIPLFSLKTCPECKKWFLQHGKTKRIFCSPRCRARRSMRQMRQLRKVIEKKGLS